MTQTAEVENKKLIAEAMDFLVECGDDAVKNGKYCETCVVITHQGGDAFELKKSHTEFSRPSKAKR